MGLVIRWYSIDIANFVQCANVSVACKGKVLIIFEAFRSIWGREMTYSLGFALDCSNKVGGHVGFHSLCMCLDIGLIKC